MVSSTGTEDMLQLRVPASDGSGDALRAAIRQARAWTEAEATRVVRITLEDGVHRIDPARDAGPDDAAITIADAERLTIIGANVELLFTDPHRGGIDLRRSRAVTLQGFTIDYASPSFTQGVILDVNADTASFRFLPHEGYPDFTDHELFTGSGYGTLREADGGALKPASRQTFMVSYSSEPDEDGAFRITVEPSDRAWMAHIEGGDGFVVGHRGDRHGIRLDGCERVTLRALTLHAAPCAAILSHESSAMLLEQVTVARRTGSTRWISSNADAVHCQGGRQGPQIIGCRFEGMHDDGVNLYVHAHVVAEVRDRRTLVLAGTGPVLAGDRLQVVDGVSGAVLAETAVHSVIEPAPCVVLLEGDLPDGVDAGAAVYNRSNALPGFRIEQSRFHDFRGIGIRLKASGGIVADCRFERLSGCGLWIANDPGWAEGPLGSRDVEIVGNSFDAAPGDLSLQTWPHSASTIMIELFSGDDGPAAARAHERIRVRDNDIVQTAATAVFVGGASDVVIEDMRVEETQGRPWLATRDSDVRVNETAWSTD